MGTKIDRLLFSPAGCLSASGFKKYLANELTPAEKKKVETHLSQCLICSEAMEGFRKQHQSVSVLKNDIDLLSNRIRRRYSRTVRKPEIPLFTVISLFVFLILVVIIYYIIRYLLTNPQ